MSIIDRVWRKPKGIPYSIEEARAIIRNPQGHDPYAVEMIAYLVSEIERLKGEPPSCWNPNTETPRQMRDRRAARV